MNKQIKKEINDTKYNKIAKYIEMGNIPAIREAIKNDINIVNIIDIVGSSLLHKAAMVGDIETARLLLNAGADINLQDKFGKTALYIACSYPEMLIYLVSRNANINIPNIEGNTALHLIAADRDYHHLYRPMLAKGGDESLKNNKNETPVKIYKRAQNLNYCCKCKQKYKKTCWKQAH